MALDHFERVDWEDLDADDAVDAELLAKRDEHERYESDEATIDVVESEDDTARCYVLYDREPPNPRVDYDNAGHMVMFKNCPYSMGDESAFYDIDDFEETTSEWTGDNRVAVILSLHVRGNGDGIFCGAYGDGAEGFIYLTRGDCLKEWGYKRITAARRVKLESYLKGEVETYDQYLTGDVYGLVTVGGPNDGDSCWGYFGLKYAREEAKAMVE